MTKPIICFACKKEIKDKDELVTVNHYFKVTSLHHDCYNKDARGVMAILFPNHRLNGWTANISFIFMFIIGIALFFMIDHSIRYIPLFFIILECYYHLVSYICFERYLSNVHNDEG
ncbi:hypothetical protein [Pallidibacillus thermolactis]|uniref:hypothetical protein n=1 Tax=Pallidibacillus thermolactis TaxID=251051 RepID=UPI00156AD12B|nr:hypothetical protein [Pallidibacillus thermolactis]MCU9601478.1 hypothetical protein [Pallidibacillus thermolactis subsp. kokeshiiformis]MED1673568.1 hypothetical protein [Pallidibacillus thermolactis subsp. kokeshiiformis]